jgi:hypothetical protein
MKTRSVETLGRWAATLLLAGCGTTIHEMALNSPDHPMTPKDPGAVEVFMSQRPSRPYAEVAMLEAQQSSEYSTDAPEAVIVKLREYAAQKGCDGLVINGGDDTTVGNGSTYRGTGSMHVRTLKGYRATCIVYKTGDPGSDTSPPGNAKAGEPQKP